MLVRIISSISFLILGAFFQRAEAYPEFIGYGYSSCLTCHFNGLGGGPLNDYGRALWSNEIASRALYPKSMDDEAIGNQSGFLGSTPLPSWIRPDIKYRGLDYQPNLGTAGSTNTYMNMQSDFGLTLQNDDTGKYLASITWGRVVQPQNYGLATQGVIDHVLATEYFVRAEIVETWWLYIGLMEKVFGIRNVDHESYQRSYEGFQVYNNTADGINNSQGIILHKVAEKWELAFNYFIGNPYDDSNHQQKGGSMMGEIDVGDKKRLGASLLTSQSSIKKKDMAAVHYRQALSKASALLFEYGLIHDQTPPGGVDATGSYNLLRAVFNLTRGYNLTATTERYNQIFNPTTTEMWKWEIGLLVFPMPRLEVRADLINVRGLSTQAASPDSWLFLGQVHVSL
jgi:hypothetical protein